MSALPPGVGPAGQLYNASAPGAADRAIEAARTQLGVPYVWGGETPGHGFDCSGLIQWAFGVGGVSLPRTTYQQVLVGAPVTQDRLAPGDLVFPDLGHVQIYVGGGQVIEAPHTGSVVQQVPMWGFMTARRVAPPGTGTYGPAQSVAPGLPGPGGSQTATLVASRTTGATGGTGLTFWDLIFNPGGLAEAGVRLAEVAAGGLIFAGGLILIAMSLFARVEHTSAGQALRRGVSHLAEAGALAAA